MNRIFALFQPWICEADLKTNAGLDNQQHRP